MKTKSISIKSKTQLILAMLVMIIGVAFAGTRSATALSPVTQFAKAGDVCTRAGDDGALVNGKLNAQGECDVTISSSRTPGNPDVNYCGDKDKNAVVTGMDFGCKHKGNAVLDLTFAIIRFLTLGVGVVVIGSMVFAGIQYTASRGDPNATGQALKRIASSAGALVLFMFIYAILNWVVPNTLLQ